MRKAGDVITALFKEQFGPEFMETARSNAGLFSSWTQIVTELWKNKEEPKEIPEEIPAAAVHSRIRELEHGVLLIEADHPGWIQILQTKQEELLSKAQKRYPELNIRAIAFRLSREPFFSPVEPAKKDEVDEMAPNEAAARDVASSESTKPRDEDFYAALKGLEESIKKRNSSKD